MKKAITKSLIGLLFLILSTGVTSVVFLSFTLKNKLSDIWAKVGLTEEVGIGNIQSGFLEGYFYKLNPSAAKKIAVGDRAAVTMDLLKFAKKYVNSPEFLDDYEWYKKEKQPKSPDPCRTLNEVRQEIIGRYKTQISQNEDAMKNFDDEMKKMVREANEVLKAQLKECEQVNSEFVSMMHEGEKNQYDAAYQKYQTDLKEFDELYPKNIKLMIKDRIELFLKVTDGIDYNAELKTVYGKKMFVNSQYERKPDQWKMGFRCGKEVTETVRKFAKEWLTEL